MILAGNILNIIAPIIQITAFLFKKKRNVLLGIIVASITWLIAFLLLKEFSAAVFSGFGIVLPLVNDYFVKRNKNKPWWIFAFFCALATSFAILFYTNLIGLLPVLACIFLIFSILPNNPIVFRVLLICLSISWLLYGCFIFQFGIIIGNSIQIISLLTMIAFKDLRKKQKDTGIKQ